MEKDFEKPIFCDFHFFDGIVKEITYFPKIFIDRRILNKFKLKHRFLANKTLLMRILSDGN